MVRKVCKGTIHVHVLVAHVHGVVVCGYLSWCARPGSLRPLEHGTCGKRVFSGPVYSRWAEAASPFDLRVFGGVSLARGPSSIILK